MKIQIKIIFIFFITVIISNNILYAQNAPELNPKEKEAYQYFQNKDFDKAIELISELIKENPENPNYHDMLGMAYNLKGERVEASKHLDKAIALDKDNPMRYVSRSMATSDFSEQESWLMKALEKDPEQDAAYAILISMYIAEAIEKNAKCHYNDALKFAQTGIKTMKDYITIIKSPSETKEPEIIKMYPTILQQVQGRLANAEKFETEIKKNIEDSKPCEN